MIDNQMVREHEYGQKEKGNQSHICVSIKYQVICTMYKFCKWLLIFIVCFLKDG